MLVKEILKIKNSKLINGKNINIDHFSINTNDILKKTLFIPLKGNTDGHNYIINGVNNKIAGFLIEPNHNDIIKESLKINDNLIIIEVPDTLKAMQELAKITRENLNIPVIALTGSYGKTTQREMINSVLKQEFKVLTTKGNLNNHIGMPLTLINYNKEEIILLELGTNHMGEIAFLRDICKPTITLITNIGTAHIGNFRNQKNIFKEKTSIIKGSKYYFKNNDDEILKKIKTKNTNIIDYSIKELDNITYNNKINYDLKINNKNYHIVINSDITYLTNYSLAALKIGLLLNIKIENIIKGIKNFKSINSRMEKLKIGKHIIIKDCYNASFETMISGLDHFNKLNTKDKIVILGDILELGNKSDKIHKNIATYIINNNLNFNEYHLVGEKMKKVYELLKRKNYNAYHYKNVEEINKDILNNHSVYLKASNGIGLSKLLD